MVWPNVSMRKFPTVYHANSENLWNWLYRRNTEKKLLNFFCCVWSCGWFFWPGRDTGYHFQNYILNSLIDCFYFCNFSYQVETILYLVMKSKQEHGQIYPHLTCLSLPVCSDKEPASELCLSDLFLSLACVSLKNSQTARASCPSSPAFLICENVSFPEEQATFTSFPPFCRRYHSSRGQVQPLPIRCSRDILDKRASGSGWWDPWTVSIFLCLCFAHCVFFYKDL